MMIFALSEAKGIAKSMYYKITQRQENGLNYIVLEPDFGTKLDECSIGMVRQNQEQIPGIVPFTVTKLDGQTHLEYDITGLQPFSRYYRKGWKPEELVTFLQNVAEAIGSLNAYSLPESQLLLENDYCYVDNGSGRVKFILLPFDVDETKSVYQFLTELMSVTVLSLHQADDVWMKINQYLVGQGSTLDLNQLRQFLEKQRRSVDVDGGQTRTDVGGGQTRIDVGGGQTRIDVGGGQTGIGVGGGQTRIGVGRGQTRVDVGGGQTRIDVGGGQLGVDGGNVIKLDDKQEKVSWWKRFLFGGKKEEKKRKKRTDTGGEWLVDRGEEGEWPGGNGWSGGPRGNGWSGVSGGSGWSGVSGGSGDWSDGMSGVETVELEFSPYLVRVKTGEKILLSSGVCRIGRESDNTYPIKDNPKVSRHHIEILVDSINESCTLSVGQNTNGTRINGGENLGIGRQVKLSDGDIIQLANEKIEFHIS